MKHFLLIFMCLLSSLRASAQMSGSGTEADPYRILEASDLDQVRNFLGKSDVYFKLVDDIDLTDWINDNNPTAGWTPIGVESSPFMGIIDGNNKTISGLKISRGETDYIGLFGCVSGATFKDFTLTGTTIAGANYTGTLAGCASGGTVTVSGLNVSFSSVEGQDYTGGLIGYVQTSVTYISSTDVKTNILVVNGKRNYYHGGIIGGASYGVRIADCSQVGNVEGSQCVGGIMGYTIKNFVLKSTSSKGNVTGSGSEGANVGGLIGQSTAIVQITSCSHQGNVSSSLGNVGGLVGLCNGQAIIKDCSSYGNVKGTNNVGGSIGEKSESESKISIQHSFACGNIEGSNQVGGLVGSLKVVTNVYGLSTYYTTTRKLFLDNSCRNYTSTKYYTLNATFNDGYDNVKVLAFLGRDNVARVNNYTVIYRGSCPEIFSKVRAELSSEKYEEGNTTAYPGSIIINRRWATERETNEKNQYVYYTIPDEPDFHYLYSFAGKSYIKNSYFSGKVFGVDNIGGIVGFAQTADLERNYVNADVVGKSNVGGVAGKLDDGNSNDGNSTIKSNIAICSVVSASISNAGRIYGFKQDDSWSIGELGTSEANKASLKTQILVNGIAPSFSEDIQNGNTVGEATLKKKSTYQGVNWDMTNDWNIQETESYPYKTWQAAPPVILEGAVAGSTSISGKSIDGGKVYLEIENKQYTAVTSGNSWTAIVDVLHAGAQISVYVESESKSPSYSITSHVAYHGSGTAEDPYQVYTADDLVGISGTSYYKLMNDIVLTEWINTNSPQTGWIPIGRNSPVAFHLDGANHEISGLWINSNEDYTGLIAKASGATIKNLSICANLIKKVNGGDYTAVLLGYGSSVTISNCHIVGNVEGKQNCAVLAGKIVDGVIDNSSANGNVKAKGVAGGLIATSGATVTNSSSKGVVDVAEIANTQVGGLVGNNSGVIETCFSTATVKSTGKGTVVGGIAGGTGTNSIINDCYSTSSLTGTAYVGGVVGYNYGNINRCYASGNIIATGIGAGISAYNCGANAKVMACVALCPKIDMNESSGIAKRVIGGYKDGAPDPSKSDNYALAEMLIAINGTLQTTCCTELQYQKVH